jgi:hypothetical protein
MTPDSVTSPDGDAPEPPTSDPASVRGSSGDRGVSRPGTNVPEAILYVTSNCHLCGVARSLLTAVQRTIPFNIRTVNIDSDDELLKRFALEVPVVEIEGEIVAQGRVDVDRIRAAVNAARIATVRRAATGE